MKNELLRNERPTRVRWRVVGLLLLLSIIGYVERVNISIAGELIMREFHISAVRLGWVFSAFLIAYTLFQTPTGVLADRFGPRLILALAGLGWGVFTILSAILPGLVFRSAAGMLGSLIAVRLMLGICEAPLYPAATRMVSRWVAHRERAFANSIVIAGALVGSAVTAPAVSSLMVHLGWRAALIYVSLLAPLIVLVWLFYTTDHPRHHRSVNQAELETIMALNNPPELALDPPGDFASNSSREVSDAAIQRGEPGGQSKLLHSTAGAARAVLRNGQAWRLTLAYGCQSYVTYLFIWWCYVYFVEVRHFSLTLGGFATSVPFVVSSITTPVAGAVSDWFVVRLGRRRGRRLLPLLVLPASAVLILAGVRANNVWVAVVVLSGGAALALAPEGPSWAAMMEMAQPVAGTAGGFLNTGGNAGGWLAAAFTPWIASRITWTGAFSVASALALVGALLWIGIDSSKTIGNKV